MEDTCSSDVTWKLFSFVFGRKKQVKIALIGNVGVLNVMSLCSKKITQKGECVMRLDTLFE